MSDATWIALGGFILSCGIAIVTTTLGIRRLSTVVEQKLEAKIDSINKTLTEIELITERRLGEMGHALREKITQVEFHFRDHYVHNEVFNKIIDMARANNENQFRVITDSMQRMNDKLDTIQANQYRVKAE
jgi:N-acetylglucosamine-6-phosphate deacetylase